jgi:hypothetical protein
MVNARSKARGLAPSAARGSALDVVTVSRSDAEND